MVTESDPIQLDAEGRITEDLACVQCGYNLRMLTKKASCPECGERVLRSMHRHPWLHDAGTIRRIRWGTLGMFIAIVLPFVAILIAFINQQPGPTSILYIAFGLESLAGWLLAAPPIFQRNRWDKLAMQTLRGCAILRVMLWGVVLLARPTHTFMDRWTVLLLLGIMTVELIGLTAVGRAFTRISEAVLQSETTPLNALTILHGVFTISLTSLLVIQWLSEMLGYDTPAWLGVPLVLVGIMAIPLLLYWLLLLPLMALMNFLELQKIPRP